jgi:hypothetical protein
MAVGMPTVQDYFADAEQFAVKWQARGSIGWKDAHRGTEQEMLADTLASKSDRGWYDRRSRLESG